jgi:hypothetical protein
MISTHMIAAVVLVGVLASVGWLGYSRGAADVTAAWTAEKLAAERLAEAVATQHRAKANEAAMAYESTRAALQAQATQARAALKNALQRPVCPNGDVNAALSLADLPVPADALQRLRDAGAASAPSP